MSAKKSAWRTVNIDGFPKRKHKNESSRCVLVRYLDESAQPDVCSYNFITNKFVFIDTDITSNVSQWCEIPT